MGAGVAVAVVVGVGVGYVVAVAAGAHGEVRRGEGGGCERTVISKSRPPRYQREAKPMEVLCSSSTDTTLLRNDGSSTYVT